jgi:hypothetical protein
VLLELPVQLHQEPQQAQAHRVHRLHQLLLPQNLLRVKDLLQHKILNQEPDHLVHQSNQEHLQHRLKAARLLENQNFLYLKKQ